MSDLTILETDHVIVQQSSGYQIPGYLIVQPKAQCTRLGELSGESCTDLFRQIALAETLVYEVVRPPRVYVMKFAEMNPQVHFHIFPRTVALEAAYLAQVDDRPPLNGARVTEWTWAHHGELGHSDEDIREFVAAARAWVFARVKA
ncbi:MAG: hypothetical protein KDB61_04335 [Planctomycetes bacterium]|nr:hypothetical protein [Planctomycetota bacterium]